MQTAASEVMDDVLRGLGVDERPAKFTPHLELVQRKLLRDVGEDFSTRFEETSAATLRLWFDYQSEDGRSIRVSAADPTARARSRELPRGVRRDEIGELRARRLLEGFGPVELEDHDELVAAMGTDADYVVDLDGDPDALVNFTMVAVPQLRLAGWSVAVDADYPCQVVKERTWYAQLEPEPEKGGNWFELQLGVEVEGDKVDLLPVLVDLLESSGSLERIGRCRRKFTALPIGGNRFLAVPPERVRRMLTTLRELYAVDGPPRGPLRIPALVPGYLDDLLDAAGGELRLEGDAQACQRARALSPRQKPPTVDAPAALRATLRPYQAEGLAWLQNLARQRAGGILADDMGLGKTLQTIAHICAEKDAGHLDQPILVVAPTSLVGNWRRELEKFAPHLRAAVVHGPKRKRAARRISEVDVVITSFPILCRDVDVFVQHGYHLVVLDEAHTIKNVRSQAHQAACALESRLRLCLTGTPVENNLEELRALFEFLQPGLFGDAGAFRSRFRNPIEKMGDEERLATLRKRVAPFILRRLKDLVAKDLPPKQRITQLVELEGEQRDLYESIRIAAHESVRGVIKKKGIAASTIDILGALMKLRQVCCDPRLVNVDAAREVAASAKFEHLMQMVPALLSEGRRILVFSQFTSMLALIGEGLRAQGVDYLALTGASQHRQQLVDAFEGGQADVFLLSLKAAGTGLNLVSADTVIHYDPWWNPAAQAQATDRAYRIGQTKSVFVYDLIVEGSVEERMTNLQRRKQALADGILGEGPLGQQLSEGDVDDLFEPLD